MHEPSLAWGQTPKNSSVSRYWNPRRRAKPGSCGYPHRHVSLQVRDAAGRILPSGQPGEIWARTPRSLECDLIGQRTRGPRDDDGFIATGDTGRVDKDGFLYIATRASGAPMPDMRLAG